jgi:biopolymer transport protein ExbB
MQNGYEFNSLEFISAGGPVSIGVALLLLAMSVASWYLIVRKNLQAWYLRREFNRYTQKFWRAPSLAVALQDDSDIALARLAQHALAAAEHHQLHSSNSALSQDEFIARAMNRCIAEEGSNMEHGFTILASVGSVSPFVGLFGTVWGIYHALASISQSGQATLDKVAGPVGEALIMTALGLAVAIPAVLAYNALLRSNRLFMNEIEEFAYKLHTLLITGAVLNTQTKTIKKSLKTARSAAASSPEVTV